MTCANISNPITHSLMKLNSGRLVSNMGNYIKVILHQYRGYEICQYLNGHGFCWKYGSGYCTLRDIQVAIDCHINSAEYDKNNPNFKVKEEV
jgi:hypothetical protein